MATFETCTDTRSGNPPEPIELSIKQGRKRSTVQLPPRSRPPTTDLPPPIEPEDEGFSPCLIIGLAIFIVIAMTLRIGHVNDRLNTHTAELRELRTMVDAQQATLTTIRATLNSATDCSAGRGDIVPPVPPVNQSADASSDDGDSTRGAAPLAAGLPRRSQQTKAGGTIQ